MIRPEKTELLRNTTDGKIAGVCAGLADHLGWEIWLVRIIVVSAFLLGANLIIVVAYVAAWLIIDKQKVDDKYQEKQHSKYTQKGVHDPDSVKVKSRVWQSGEPAKQAVYDIRKKFDALEAKLRSMEQYVTSDEFTLNREINKL
jgi:phage shock protein C